MSRSARAPRSRWIALVSLALAALAGCRPQIGDSCASSTDCSAQGDRLCDATQPDGYCTIFSCEPDACPEASVCVGFGEQLDPTCTPAGTDPRWQRFERTFCMLACEEDGDCRDGYVCVKPSTRRAVSLDETNELRDSGVCFVASEASLALDGDPPTCQP